MRGDCVIRVDSGYRIGVGHVSRCLTLAEALRQRCLTVRFLCREHPGAALGWIEGSGFPVHRLPASGEEREPAGYASWLGEDWRLDATRSSDMVRDAVGQADWLIVDHYGIDAHWEAQLRKVARRILVIDDLADRRHDCDLLVDQSLRDGDPYRHRLPSTAKTLLGPRYALLRDEFRVAHTTVAPRDGQVRHMVVFFGGTDPTDETSKALEALRFLPGGEIKVDVIVGNGNPCREKVARMCESLGFARYHCQVSDMARFYAQADLALGAAGVSSWERLAVGLPALVVAVAENQVENMRQLDCRGVAIALGTTAQVAAGDMSRAMNVLFSAPEKIKVMSEKALSMVDGNGASRVVDEMLGEHDDMP